MEIIVLRKVAGEDNNRLGTTKLRREQVSLYMIPYRLVFAVRAFLHKDTKALVLHCSATLCVTMSKQKHVDLNNEEIRNIKRVCRITRLIRHDLQ